MPQKRRRRRKKPRLEAPPSGSLVDSDSSSRVDGGSPPPAFPDEPLMSGSPDEPPDTGPAYESRYHQIIASRLAELQLPHAADGSDFAGSPSLPSTEIIQALTRKSLHDDDSRAALLEYQCQFLSETCGPDTDSGHSEPDDLIMDERYTQGLELVGARLVRIDTYTQLDQEQANKLHLKYALYRIKAALLLKGKPVDELDDHVLERKYPPELIVQNRYFLHYVPDGYFGWYFNDDLLYKKYLTDYQRLVLLNDNGGDEYTSWRKYRAFYSTPEADREYLQYWETIVKKMKWLEQYLLINVSSYEWSEIHSKASVQALRIASEFPHITMELASTGLNEYIWNTHNYLLSLKDLDGVFYEIWLLVNMDHQGFKDAVKQVYDKKLYPARDCNMECELKYGISQMELLYHQCTEGLSKNVSKNRARELIAQEILWRVGFSGSYEQYARKKLKIAELLGLIPRDSMVAA